MTCPNRQETCALYMRVSTQEQADNYSLSSQEKAQRRYAEERGYAIIESLCDDGYTAADLERPALTQLRELVRKKLIDVVVVFEPDRLIRNVACHILLHEEFEKACVRCEYVKFAVTNDDEGKLMLNIKAVIGEYEKAKIKDRTMRGRKEKAGDGLIVGGRRTYGYSVLESGEYVVNELEAAVIRQIHCWFDAGLSIRKIVLTLNTQGHKPHSAERWGKSTVHRILSNDFYIGKAYYNRRKRVRGKNPSITQRNKNTKLEWRERVEWIDIAVPALIDEEVFYRAQKRLIANREQKSGRPPRHSWLLRGLIKCGKCGRRYGSKPSHGSRYYRCTGNDAVAARQCDAPKLNANQLEASVMKDLKKVLSNPQLLQSKLSHAARTERDLDRELQSVNARLGDLQQQEAKLLKHFLNLKESMSETLLERTAIDLKRERIELEALRRELLNALRVRAEKRTLISAALSYCKRIEKYFEKLTFDKARTILETLIDQIVVNGSAYEIYGAISFDLGEKLSTTS